MECARSGTGRFEPESPAATARPGTESRCALRTPTQSSYMRRQQALQLHLCLLPCGLFPRSRGVWFVDNRGVPGGRANVRHECRASSNARPFGGRAWVCRLGCDPGSKGFDSPAHPPLGGRPRPVSRERSVVVSGSDQGAGRAHFPCVAQAGRAPRSGRGGRRFESVHTDRCFQGGSSEDPPASRGQSPRLAPTHTGAPSAHRCQRFGVGGWCDGSTSVPGPVPVPDPGRKSPMDARSTPNRARARARARESTLRVDLPRGASG